MTRNLTLAASLIVFASPLLAQNAYQLDPAHSSARFAAKHMTVSEVHGEFDKVSGTVSYDPKNVSGDRLEATIDLGSVNTNQLQRDADLKSPNFFDVAKYPTMTFRGTHFERRGSELIATGDLTLHGVTKPLTLVISQITPEVKDPYGMQRFGAHASATLNRKDFGITWNQTLDNGGSIVSDEVVINLDAEFVRPATK